MTIPDARERLRSAAAQGLIERGPDVTVERIAEIAGVGRRTAFRHFPSRDQLLAAGIEWITDTYLARMPSRGKRPVQAWLRELAAESAAIVGAGGPTYVALLATDWGSEAIRTAMSRREASRQAFARHVALEAWRGSGRAGSPPPRLVAACLLFLGPFAHQALRIDGGCSADEASDLTAALLLDVLRSVCDETHGG